MVIREAHNLGGDGVKRDGQRGKGGMFGGDAATGGEGAGKGNARRGCSKGLGRGGGGGKMQKWDVARRVGGNARREMHGQGWGGRADSRKYQGRPSQRCQQQKHESPNYS